MEAFQHNQVKLAVGVAIQQKAMRERLGLFFTDGMSLLLPDADRSYKPDGFYISYRNLVRGCRFRRNARNAVMGIEGVPTLIVEVASPSRIAADYEVKLQVYRKAGVKEFWLFRPGGAGYGFDLLTLDRDGDYYQQRPFGHGGYSKVLRCYCRLVVLPTPIEGLPCYVLALEDARGVRNDEKKEEKEES